MTAQAPALLLVGSPKKGTSTSEALGDRLLDRLGRHGVAAGTVRLHRATSSAASREELLRLVDAAGLVVLATPLYFDSLPSHVIGALEFIAARFTSPRGRFASLLNCGLPEARQNDTAVRICREFAREAGFAWAGALAMGAGEMIGGRPLGKVGVTARHVVAALDLAGDALAAGEPIPAEAVTLMAKPLVAASLFAIMGDVGWRLKARRFGAQWRMHAQPYAEGTETP